LPISILHFHSLEWIRGHSCRIQRKQAGWVRKQQNAWDWYTWNKVGYEILIYKDKFPKVSV
jgi:hypothetical protein